MEIEIQQTTVVEGYTSRQVQHWLGVSNSRLRHYVILLRQSCPDEFTHPKGSAFYSTESYLAIKKVRQMFRLGATENQVKNTLRIEGF